MKDGPKHIVNYSGGITSWLAARRLIDRLGTTDGVVLLFADVLTEDADLYRFLDESSADLGLPVTVIAEGRTPWEVMRDEKIIGNSRIDPCSKILKRKLLDRWTKEHCDADAIIYVGLDWTEPHRLVTLRERLSYRVEAPCTEKPLLTKDQIKALLRDRGIKPPRLYDMGFVHNNCGGACIKAGQAQWELLLRVNPRLYLEKEQWEQEMRELVGNHSILRSRRGKKSSPLTLKEFRERLERDPNLFDRYDWGGCGRAV